MPAPATVAELLDLVQKSGVAEETRLATHLEKLKKSGAIPSEPAKLAGILVRDGLLTYFQAEQLLLGKYKRFSLGKYKVLEKLGSGGMGTVFLCEHKLMRRRVAVKVLPTAKAQDEASLGRFYREARAVAAVDHPNIVRAYDIDQDENLHFLVMEYVDGTNLQDLVKKFGALDVVRACHYMYGAAVGLQHACEIGLIHRDIKPGNILLDRSGVVKILDMGLARLLHDTEDNLTKQYDENILGTADYLSPEQAEDSHTVDIRSDIYSLGATFYFLLTGQQPFPEGTIPQKLIWHRSRQPKSVRELRPEVPEEVVAIVTKMMAKKPEDRFQTPAEVMAALAPWASMPIAPPAEREMPQLSPAVSGGQSGGTRPGTGGSPRTMVATAPAHHGASTLVAGSMSSSSGSGEAVWESLGEAPLETTPIARGSSDTDVPSPKSSGYRTVAAAKSKQRNRTLALVAVGALAIVGTAAGIYIAVTGKSTPDPVVPGERSKRIVVSRSPSAGTDPTHATLAEALQKASPGDTIVISEPTLAEPALRLINKKDLTIESGLPGGSPVLIDFSSSGGSTLPMISLSNCENIRFRNIELDGKGVADMGVQITGVAPGVTLEGVTVRNVKSAPFRFSTVAGQPGRPAVLDRVRAIMSPLNRAAVIIAVPTDSTTETRHVAIRNSRFEGPSKAGVLCEGSLVEVDVGNNRFFNLESAIVMTRVGEGRPYKVRLTQNTFCEAKIGLQFIGEGAGKMDVALTRNYFAKTQNIVDGPGVVGMASIDNAQRESGPGNNMSITAQPLDAPQLPPPNPADDATFLRFPGGGPVVNGSRVGAN